jgi:hypothetical protein
MRIKICTTIIPPVYLYVWSFVSQIKVCRLLDSSESRTEEVAGGRRKLHDGYFHDLYCGTGIICVV